MRVYRAYDDIAHYVSISDANRHPDLTYAATIHHGLDLTQFTPGPGDGGYLLFLGRIHPDKGTHLAIEVARRAGMPLVIAGVVHDEPYFRSLVEPHVDGSPGALRRIGRALPSGTGCWAAPPRCCTSSTSRSRSGSSVVEALAAGTPGHRHPARLAARAGPRRRRPASSSPTPTRRSPPSVGCRRSTGAPAAARPRPGSARTAWSTTTSGSSTASSPAGAGDALPQHDGGGRRTVDVYLITDDGVRECAVDELPALLSGRHGIVWVDIPQWSPRPPTCSPPRSGCTRWPCTTARSATGCPSCTRTRARSSSSCTPRSAGPAVTSTTSSSTG